MKINPKIDMKQYEMNIMTKFLWNQLGFNRGSLMSCIISVSIIGYLSLGYSLYFVCFIIGALTITNLLHIQDMSIIRSYKKGNTKHI